jgi:hypothetical protein
MANEEKRMKNGVLLGSVLWAVVIGACLWGAVKKPAIAGVQDQAQASTLAVPDQSAELPFAGAIVVVQCKNVVAVVMIKHDGTQQPIDLKNATQAIVATQLLQAPADAETEIEVSCKLEVIKGSGSV